MIVCFKAINGNGQKQQWECEKAKINFTDTKRISNVYDSK